MCIQCHLVLEQLCHRYCANKKEHAVAGKLRDFICLNIAHLDPCDSAFTINARQYAVPDKLHLRVMQRLFGRLLVAVQDPFFMEYYNNYLSGEFCNVHTFLDTLIAAANHHNRLILKEFRITSCAVGYAHTGQFFLAGDSQYPSRGASGNNHSLCLVFMAAGIHLFRVASQFNSLHLLTSNFSAKLFCMLRHLLGKDRSTGSGDTGVIHNFTGGVCTSSGVSFF